MQLRLSSNLKLILEHNPETVPAQKDPGLVALETAFSKSQAAGVLCLARDPLQRRYGEGFAFWADFADYFLSTFCTYSDTDPLLVPLSDQQKQVWIETRPPLPGNDLIDTDFIARLWSECVDYIKDQLKSTGLSSRLFITQYYPRWADVGRIHFNLAENPESQDRPFVFLATYSVRVASRARIQHRPLGLALRDSLRSGQPQKFEQLLQPVRNVAETSNFLANHLSDQSLFKPLPLTLEQTSHFLRDVSLYEKVGIICKTPDWWKASSPPRAKVGVTFSDGPNASEVGINGLLGFNVGMSIGGQPLSPEQIDDLLSQQGPLVKFSGHWIEADIDKLKHLLRHWRQAADYAKTEGIPISRVLRLISRWGKDELKESAGLITADAETWYEFEAGQGLKEYLGFDLQQRQHANNELNDILNIHVNAKLRPYQQTGVLWLHTLQSMDLGGCLADDMGLGKTLQMIAMLTVLKHATGPVAKQFTNYPHLLIVPTSLIGNWLAEFAKFAPSLDIKVAHSSYQSQQSLVYQLDATLENVKHSQYQSQNQSGRKSIDVVITSYGMLQRLPQLVSQQWNLIIADEAQAIKNHDTQQARTVRKLQGRCRFAMTGTPVENNLSELWSLFEFCCPGLLGNQNKFREALKELPKLQHHVDYAPLRRLLEPFLLRRKKTDRSIIADLPDKVEVNRYYRLTPKQAALYQQSVAELADELKKSDGIGRKGLILSFIMRFKQICNHPSQYLADNAYGAQQSGKFLQLQSLAQHIAEKGEKLLVFTQFKELTDILSHLLTVIFGREGLVLHGSTAALHRQQLVADFQRDNGPPFFVLSLKAGGVGLNLTAASHVIHFDRWWNPAVENQATDRAYRIGQHRNVMVHKFICRGTIEENIDRMILSKRELAENVVGESEFRITELSNDELMRLVQLDISQIGEDTIQQQELD